MYYNWHVQKSLYFIVSLTRKWCKNIHFCVFFPSNVECTSQKGSYSSAQIIYVLY